MFNNNDYIYRCIREEGLEKAVELTKDLLGTVKSEYERGPPPQQYHRGGGYYGRGGYRGGYHSGMRVSTISILIAQIKFV